MHITVSIILTILGAAAGAVCYRLGGAAGYNTKFRDIGVPLVACLVMWSWGWGHWSLVLCFGLLFASLTTYFKKSGHDARWWNWALCGLAYGVSALPIAWAFDLWWGFIYRTIFLVGSITAWSEFIDDPVWEECGRGFLIIASIPILMTG